MYFEEEQWIERLLNNLFNEKITQEILAIPIKHQHTMDELVWTGTKCGSYTIKNGYKTLQREMADKSQEQQPFSSFHTPKALWNAIWNMQTRTKAKIFLWSICQNAIPSKENLSSPEVQRERDTPRRSN